MVNEDLEIWLQRKVVARIASYHQSHIGFAFGSEDLQRQPEMRAKKNKNQSIEMRPFGWLNGSLESVISRLLVIRHE